VYKNQPSRQTGSRNVMVERGYNKYHLNWYTGTLVNVNKVLSQLIQISFHIITAESNFGVRLVKLSNLLKTSPLNRFLKLTIGKKIIPDKIINLQCRLKEKENREIVEVDNTIVTLLLKQNRDFWGRQ